MLKLVYINNITVRLLEPCQLEDYPITTLFENNRFSSFFLQTEQGNSRFNYACGNATVETF